MSSQAAMLIIYMPKFTWPACRSTILPYTRRMKGAAKAYGVSIDSTGLDFSILPYDAGSLGCSMVYFPSYVTYNGYAMVCLSLVFRTAPLDIILLSDMKIPERTLIFAQSLPALATGTAPQIQCSEDQAAFSHRSLNSPLGRHHPPQALRSRWKCGGVNQLIFRTLENKSSSMAEALGLAFDIFCIPDRTGTEASSPSEGTPGKGKLWSGHKLSEGWMS